jgi:hypothetical protein
MKVRSIVLVLVLFNLTNSLTPILCQTKIVNAFIERYPKKGKNELKYFIQNRSIFEFETSKLTPDTSKQSYETRVSINEKSINCNNRYKSYVFISSSCKTILVSEVQYLIPENVKNELKNIPKNVLMELNLKKCIEEINQTKKKS